MHDSTQCEFNINTRIIQITTVKIFTPSLTIVFIHRPSPVRPCLWLKNGGDLQFRRHSDNVGALALWLGAALLLGEVGRQRSRPGEGVRAAPRRGSVGAVAAVFPGVGEARRAAEHRHGGEADGVGVVSGGSEALLGDDAAGSLAIRGKPASDAG